MDIEGRRKGCWEGAWKRGRDGEETKEGEKSCRRRDATHGYRGRKERRWTEREKKDAGKECWKRVSEGVNKSVSFREKERKGRIEREGRIEMDRRGRRDGGT